MFCAKYAMLIIALSIEWWFDAMADGQMGASSAIPVLEKPKQEAADELQQPTASNPNWWELSPQTLMQFVFFLSWNSFYKKKHSTRKATRSIALNTHISFSTKFFWRKCERNVSNIICILVLVLLLDRNQERQMIRRKKFSLLQIQNIFLYFAGGQEVSGHFSISHQRCYWATVSLISQQPRPVQYFASNPIICEASQQSFK